MSDSRQTSISLTLLQKIILRAHETFYNVVRNESILLRVERSIDDHFVSFVHPLPFEIYSAKMANEAKAVSRTPTDVSSKIPKKATIRKKHGNVRNRPIGKCGIMRLSRFQMYNLRGKKRRSDYRVAKPKKEKKAAFVVKEIGGEKNGGTRKVPTRRKPRAYQTQELRRKQRHKTFPFKNQKRRLRASITPGTVLILLAGSQRGKRVIFLKQLSSGLLLVTGPFILNQCPLRRIEQIYVIATKTKVDLGKMKVPKHLNDAYFKRKDVKKTKHAEGEIFDTKQEKYKPSKQRKADQVEVDRKVMEAIKKHPDKRALKAYLCARFKIRTGQCVHKLIF